MVFVLKTLRSPFLPTVISRLKDSHAISQLLSTFQENGGEAGKGEKRIVKENVKKNHRKDVLKNERLCFNLEKSNISTNPPTKFELCLVTRNMYYGQLILDIRQGSNCLKCVI